jgi:hypothetical protein
MADNAKLKQIMELLQALSPEEKQQFAVELSDDNELMTSLLDVLVERNRMEESTPEALNSEEGYINFLRKVKD